MPKIAVALLALCLLASGAKGATGVSAKRIALVIGNSAYENVPHLANPANDARAVAAAFKRLGFDNVQLMLDQDYSSFRRNLRKFAREAAGADLALIFYAGHGIEIGGQNYLIPTDAELNDVSDVDFEAIPLSLVMGTLDRVKKLKLVMLDACRDSPFRTRMKKPGATRSIGRGLARVTPRGQNSLVAYAAREGTVARDGDGKHSPYVTAFLDHIDEPGLEIGFLFRKIRDGVVEKTGGQQEPFVYGSLSGEAIYFKPPGAPKAPPAPAPAPSPSGFGGAAMAWGHVKTSTDIETLKIFIAQYGAENAFYARLATMRIKQLEKKTATLTLAPTKPPSAEKTPPKTVSPPTDPAYRATGVCRRDLMAWRKKASVGAFAVERDGGCGWTWGSESVETARQSALRSCGEQGSDCRVIEVHTDRLGDWSLSTACKKSIVGWRKKETKGAFAIEQSGGCGWSFGFGTVKEARQSAIKECRKQGSNCRVIEVR